MQSNYGIKEAQSIINFIKLQDNIHAFRICHIGMQFLKNPKHRT